MEVVAACEDAMEALAVLNGEGADAMFIDINMPDVNGLDFVVSLRQKPIVVFVTAYAQYAADSFRVAPVDYLLKPYAFADFQRAACRVVRQFELERKAESPVVEAGSLYVKVDYRYVRVELKDIRYIEGMSDYLRIHLAGDPRPLITHSTFRQIAAYLSPSFLQVHKSYIVNMDQVLEIQRMKSGELKVITSGKQYVVSSSVDSSPKGIKAEGRLVIEGGRVMVSTTGGEGSEGIESKDAVTISGGTMTVTAADDCINATNHIEISGGEVYCYGSGNDAIDSNGTLTISGGIVVAVGSDAPEAGFDCDQNTFTVSGGTFLGISGSTSSPTASASTQPSVVYCSSLSKGTLLTITDNSGDHVMSYTIPLAFSKPTILFSSPSLAKGQTYTFLTGGMVSGGTEFYGLVTGATYDAGTKADSFTISSMLTSVGQTGGGPGGGGPGGGRF